MEDPKLDSIFQFTLSGQSLKLVRNEFVQQDYELFLHGKPIAIVDYDSTTSEIRLNYPGRFFGNVSVFRRLPNGEVKIVLIFRGSGTAADFIATKQEDRWQITKRIFGKI
ncbi:hypothetical protein [Larkinella soli]|uniref:hypothetical protein n=1 Tax=Larkinella soli TaxID=1770527 RepID=UPI000FFCBBC9|nr:hypothetical protein [Larkinella soli]